MRTKTKYVYLIMNHNITVTYFGLLYQCEAYPHKFHFLKTKTFFLKFPNKTVRIFE